jgi:Transposase domain (DUF772)
VQAYCGASDDEALERMVMDRRWQLVLDCLDAPAPPFAKGTLVAFRHRLIDAEPDRRLIERTIELAQRSGGFGPRALRAALDSSPLWGAGRVEDTINLLGHALRKSVHLLARAQGREPPAVAAWTGLALLAGPSLKASLALDWDDPSARDHALALVLDELERLEALLAQQTEPPPAALASLQTARQVVDQDVTTDAQGHPMLRQGVARDRRIFFEDGQMRHGRKSRSTRVDGSKRHVLTDLDTQLVRAVGVTLANEPKAQAARSAPIWPPSRPSWVSCTSIGLTCPGLWSATVPRMWPSSARPMRCEAGAGLSRPPLSWTLGPGRSVVPRGCGWRLPPGVRSPFPRMSARPAR